MTHGPTSGAATLEVEMPSGYGFVQSDGNLVVAKQENTFLRDVLVVPNSKVVWMFDTVSLFPVLNAPVIPCLIGAFIVS